MNNNKNIKENNMKRVTIFTDGACKGNPGFGGYAAIMSYNGHEKEIVGSVVDTTNNRMELMAVIAALESLKEPVIVELYSDSTYVTSVIAKWLDKWVRKGFKKIKNVDLWLRYLEAAATHVVHTHHVNGHTGNVLNERCDKLASDAAEALKAETQA